MCEALQPAFVQLVYLGEVLSLRHSSGDVLVSTRQWISITQLTGGK
ncbi:MAG: hypothetical protein FWD27_08030 [Coriobacteriia bacterium]|nr:hypothetical protein [Coriobacteriia bacterium]